jgi:hypothetical protein
MFACHENVTVCYLDIGYVLLSGTIVFNFTNILRAPLVLISSHSKRQVQMAARRKTHILKSC